MYKIATLNKISPVGLSELTDRYQIIEETEKADGIVVRSQNMKEMDFSENLLCIARAGVGVNNIPTDRCTEKGIAVFNTPGANANAVKEMVIAAMLLASRDIIGGSIWSAGLTGDIAKQVEKGKSQFVGPEISGKRLGVIGLGAIGILVANAAKSLGMEVYGYDPYLSVDAAWGLSRSTKHAQTLDEIYANCDYITLHVPLTPDTKEMINAESIAKMQDHVRILNFARGDLVNSGDILKALADGKVASYVTDFPTDEMLGAEGVIAVPHLGASTPESEDNCARMAADELKDYLENGNILHSVNLPNVSMPRDPAFTRVCIIHRNVPNTISLLAGKLADAGINIENMQSKSRKDYAYTILDVTGDFSSDSAKKMEESEDIIRVRVI